ncbi:nucleotide exchange factor GrpE [Leptotrichia hongkongensis]|jgi:hypothetical protein|uniref:nucleotide exchange factor GrpE n=1 Tax=Leptotrichia hongkongensis TaxID=554406 RepID=UPI0035A8BC82
MKVEVTEKEVLKEEETEEIEEVNNGELTVEAGEEKELESSEVDEVKDDENKEEDKIKKILENIENINKKVDVMNESFLKKIQSNEFEKETADRLYNELQEYKNDLYFQLIKPIMTSLISIRESMKKGLKNFGKLSEDEKFRIFESYIEEVEIILENNDLEIYETDVETDSYVDLKKQKIIKKIITPYEQLHGKIENILSSGYMYKGKIISPEKVEVNIYKKPVENLEGE